MGLEHLTVEERGFVRLCLKAATEGPFFPEWEFGTLFGLTRDEVRSVWSSWPTTLDPGDEVARRAINNCLANLLGYPHGEQEAWDRLISASRDEVARVYAKWREINRDFILDGVRKAVEALAAPGETALATMPEGSVKADELALDFDNFGRAALESLGSEMTEVQRESLRNIDRLLSAMIGGHQADLWTEEAVRTHPKWQDVRDAAGRALTDFGWEGHTG